MRAGAYCRLRYLAIVLNIIFLFGFGTGQAYCYCNDEDDCGGSTNTVAISSSLLLEKFQTLINPLQSAQLTQLASCNVSSFDSELEESLPRSIQTSKKDCCADCFKSINTAVLGSMSVEMQEMDLECEKISFPYLAMNCQGRVERSGIRAPPSIDGPGNKIYLSKRVLLI